MLSYVLLHFNFHHFTLGFWLLLFFSFFSLFPLPVSKAFQVGVYVLSVPLADLTDHSSICLDNCVSTVAHRNLIFKMWSYELFSWVCTKTDKPGSDGWFKWLSAVLTIANRIWKSSITRQSSLRKLSPNCLFNCNIQNGNLWKLIILLPV